MGYFDDDLPASISQGGVTTTFTLTGGGRCKTQVTKNSAGSRAVVNAVGCVVQLGG